MSEEIKEQIATDAAESERSEDQQNTQDAATDEADAPEDDAEPPEGDEAETEGADDEDDEDDDGEDKPRRKKSTSERLRQKNARLQARIAELESGSARVAVEDAGAVEAAVKAQIGEPPKEADFTDWFDYRDAKAAYEADRRVAERQVKTEAKRAAETQTARIADLIDDYQDNVKAVSKDLPDFLKVVNDPSFKTSDLVKQLILESGEKAPLVAYHLAQNPKTCARLNALSPLEAAREVGRIEARVSSPKTQTTRAPSPVKPVKGSAPPPRALGKSMSDYERWRNS